MDRIGKAWDLFQEKIVENFSRYGLLAVISLAFLEVVRRYIFGATFIWSGDVEIYFNLAVVFLYFGMAEKQKVHIRLDLFLAWIQKKRGWHKLGKGLEIVSTLISLSFCALFIWFGIEFVKVGIDFGRKMENADLFLWPFYVVLLVGFLFLGIEFARTLYRQIRKGEEAKS
jgi:TRAP-type C4-dicarboxylate transport system permease small subunit